MDEQINYYTLLGVSPTATLDEIRRAYRQQIARYHPDRFVGTTAREQIDASRHVQRINEGYRILSNQRLRAAYNRSMGLAPLTTELEQDYPPEQPLRRPPRRTTAAATGTPTSEEFQAALYQRARKHLDAEHYAEAVADLRQLQKLNPFYADSTILLLRAESLLRQSNAQDALAQRNSGGRPPRPPRRRTPTNATWITPLLAVVLACSLIGLLVYGLPQLLPLITPRPVEQPPQSEQAQAAQLTPTLLTPATAAPAPTVSTAAPPAEQEPVPPTAAPAPPTPSPQPPTATPDPLSAAGLLNGTLLDSDDFTTRLGWSEAVGNGWSAAYDGDTYRITASPQTNLIWSYSTIGTNEPFLVVADVAVQGDAGGVLPSFLDAQNYLACLINPTTRSFLILQRTAGQRVVLAEGESAAIRSDATATNRVGCTLADGQVQMLVNEQVVAALNTNAPAVGQYGLGAEASTQATEAVFDNLEVRTLE